MLLLSVPLATAEVILITRAPWWRLPYPVLGTWAAVVFLISLSLSFWICRGRRWGFRSALILGGAWLLLNTFAAVRMRNPALGFFTILLLSYLGATFAWIHAELSRSFFDPKIAWYQRVPQPIPSLICHAEIGQESRDFRVSRLDSEGAFLFSNGSSRATTIPLKIGKKTRLTFEFRDRRAQCDGAPIRVLADGVGAGFQFRAMSPDVRKELNEFIENLRGEGYV